MTYAFALPVVPAVFASREDAEVALDALPRNGVDERDIGVAVPEPRRFQHREPSDSEVVATARQGCTTGATVVFGAGGLHARGREGLALGAVIGELLGVMVLFAVGGQNAPTVAFTYLSGD
jgi:hypothetical protein